MLIYKLTFDADNYKNMHFSDKRIADEYLQKFDGTSIKENWSIPSIESFDDKLPLGDVSCFSIPIFNKKTLDILFPLIKDNIEVLPMQYANETLYGINVLTMLDAIDYENSDYLTFSDKKRIMMFKRYSFKPEIVLDCNIFKIVDEPRRNAFVSEEFYNVVKKNELKGFKFELLDEVTSSKETEDQSFYNYNAELDLTIQKEIRDNYHYAIDIFGIIALDIPKAVRKVHDIVEESIYMSMIPKDYDDITDVAVGLGVLFGQFICDSYGWKWRAVGKNKENFIISVVSPDDCFCIFPLNYMNRILSARSSQSDEKEDNTILLLYNMLETIKSKPHDKRLCPLT